MKCLLAAILVLACSSCSNEIERLKLGFRLEGDRLVLEPEPSAHAHIELFRGVPWTADRRLGIEWVGLAFSSGYEDNPETTPKPLRRIPPGREVSVPIEREELPIGEWIFQSFASGGSADKLPRAVSEPVYVRHDGQVLEARRFSEVARERHLTGVLVLYGSAMLAMIVAHRVGLRRMWLLVILALLMAGAWYRMDFQSGRIQSDYGGQMAPILWPDTWSTDDRHWERMLGEDIEPLVRALLTARQGEEAVTLYVSTYSGKPALTAMRLRLEIHEARVRLLGKAAPAGLCVFLGCEPPAPPQFENHLGALLRLP